MQAEALEIIGGHYRVQRLLGRGSMGNVFLAREIRSGIEVAIKIAAHNTREAREYFQREVEVSMRVDHAHVVEVLDFGTTRVGGEDVLFLVMELLHGLTLGEHLADEGELPVTRAMQLVRQAALGLEAAHTAGVVHRDVKPDNFFLCRNAQEERVKLLDFGLASLLSEPPSLDGNVVGTVEYMAPEQIVTERVDARTDVYGLGVVMFRLLTGELPFDLALRTELLAHQMITPAPPLSWLRELPEGLEEVVLRALNKHPENRYPSMRALIDDLDLVLSGEGQRIVPCSLVRVPDLYEPESEFGRQAYGRLRRVLRASSSRYRAVTPSHLRIKREERELAQRISAAEVAAAADEAQKRA